MKTITVTNFKEKYDTGMLSIRNRHIFDITNVIFTLDYKSDILTITLNRGFSRMNNVSDVINEIKKSPFNNIESYKRILVIILEAYLSGIDVTEILTDFITDNILRFPVVTKNPYRTTLNPLDIMIITEMLRDYNENSENNIYDSVIDRFKDDRHKSKLVDLIFIYCQGGYQYDRDHLIIEELTNMCQDGKPEYIDPVYVEELYSLIIINNIKNLEIILLLNFIDDQNLYSDFIHDTIYDLIMPYYEDDDNVIMLNFIKYLKDNKIYDFLSDSELYLLYHYTTKGYYY